MEAYQIMHVERNTIVNQAPIADLATVNPKRYEALRKTLNKNDSLSTFAKLCCSFCVG